MALLHGGPDMVLFAFAAITLVAVGLPALIVWLIPGIPARAKWRVVVAMAIVLALTWAAIAATDGNVPELSIVIAPATVGLALLLRARMRVRREPPSAR